MSKWYEARSDRVTPVDVIRETEKSLFLRQKNAMGQETIDTVRKRGDYVTYFSTEAEAIAWLIERQASNVTQAIKQLDYQRKKLETLKKKYGAE